MKKPKTFYSCQACGYHSPKWLGKCPDCGEWNSLVEENLVEENNFIPDSLRIMGKNNHPQLISEISLGEGGRIKTGIAEFDRVLGGGIVAGSVVLVGGDPGIGKSTLLLQVLDNIGLSGRKILYVSGEESTKQTKMRGERLKVSSSNLYLVSETSLEATIKAIEELKPEVVVIDSIQTMYTPLLQSAPGSISQVRETSGKLIYVSKTSNRPIFLIGHMTKEGAIAGPRVLEHMVDTVLYFEGDRGHPYRILRAVKNRFGSTNEIGVFEMKDSGLQQVLSPSELFLAERPKDAPGSAVISCIEGSRPILVELQALVTGSVFGMPRRTSLGVDYNRLSLLVAVLEKKAGLNLSGQDIFLNVAGGVKIEEPAVDLGIIIAVASSFLNKAIDAKTVVFGEVGLAGEIRGINQGDIRINEAARLGFNRCVLPANNKKRVKAKKGIELAGVASVKEALDLLF